MKQVGMLAKLQQPWLRWAGRGFWAVTDQALFAGTNFLVSILLARWLEPAAYGAFSVAFAVFLLLGTLHTALWTEPMMVYGSGRFREAFVAYQQVLLGYHWRFGVLSAVAFLLLGLGFWVYGEREVGLSFFGLALAAPTVLYLWLVRRGAYVLLEPRLAAFGGGLYLVLYLGLAVLLLRFGLLNEASALWAMGLAALLAAEAIRLRLGRGRASEVNTAEVRALHWGYGRWALLAGLLSWVPGNIYFLLLPTTSGLETAGAFRALYNLVMPALHFNSALAGLYIPVFKRQSPVKLAFYLRLAYRLQIGSGLLYVLALLLSGPWLINALYHGKYGLDGLFFLSLVILAEGITNVTNALLRVLELPRLVTATYFIMSVGSLLVLPLTLALGPEGAALGVFMAKLVGAVFSLGQTKGRLGREL